MTYELRRSAKDELMLTPEEEDVRRALKEYTDDPEQTDVLDFVPTKVLYQVYRNYAAHYANDPDAPDTLTIRQFGAALLRVFAHLDEGRDDDPDLGRHPDRVKRAYHGKRMWGYQRLKGPLSIRSHDGPGRPGAPKE